jgi:N-acetylmuramoyl-L-alanine amidase
MLALTAPTTTSDQPARRLLTWTLTIALTVGTVIGSAATTAALAYLAWGQETAVVNDTTFKDLPLDPVLAQAVRKAATATPEELPIKQATLTQDASPETQLTTPGLLPFGSFEDIQVNGTPIVAELVSNEIPAEVLEGSPAGAPADAAHSKERFIVMIDPGHGGSDPGAKAPNGLLEKDITQDIAQRARLFLSEIQDMDVLMTREGDTGLSRQARVNRIKASGADLVVSLHFNHLPQSNVTLVESFYADRKNILESRSLQREAGAQLQTADSDIDLEFTAGSARLARMIQNRVYHEVSNGNTTAIDAGVKQDTLFVLTRSFLPGALVEMTAISNPREAERLTQESYRNELAAALADAIRDYRASLEEHPLDALDV